MLLARPGVAALLLLDRARFPSDTVFSFFFVPTPFPCWPSTRRQLARWGGCSKSSPRDRFVRPIEGREFSIPPPRGGGSVSVRVPAGNRVEWNGGQWMAPPPANRARTELLVEAAAAGRGGPKWVQEAYDGGGEGHSRR